MDLFEGLLCCGCDRSIDSSKMQTLALDQQQHRASSDEVMRAMTVRDSLVDEDTPMHLQGEDLLAWFAAGEQQRKVIARSSLARHQVEVLEALLLTKQKRLERNETVDQEQEERENATIAHLQKQINLSCEETGIFPPHRKEEEEEWHKFMAMEDAKEREQESFWAKDSEESVRAAALAKHLKEREKLELERNPSNVHTHEVYRSSEHTEAASRKANEAKVGQCHEHGMCRWVELPKHHPRPLQHGMPSAAPLWYVQEISNMSTISGCVLVLSWTCHVMGPTMLGHDSLTTCTTACHTQHAALGHAGFMTV